MAGFSSSAATNTHSAKSRKPKVFVTEGNDVALTGICVFFIRTNPSKAITAENIHRVSTLCVILCMYDFHPLIMQNCQLVTFSSTCSTDQHKVGKG